MTFGITADARQSISKMVMMDALNPLSAERQEIAHYGGLPAGMG